MTNIYEEADRKERETLTRIKAFADAIRDTGGDCECDEYGIFKVELVDGRVFRKAGMHGWGGVFRLHRPEKPARPSLKRERSLKREQDHVIAQARRRIEEAREDKHHRTITFYLANCYCGSEILQVTPEQILSVELEP